MKYKSMQYEDLRPLDCFWTVYEDRGDLELMKQKNLTGDAIWADNKQICGLEENYDGSEVWIAVPEVWDYPIIIYWFAFMLIVAAICIMIYYKG